jgi:hypothetical protein
MIFKAKKKLQVDIMFVGHHHHHHHHHHAAPREGNGIIV